MRAVGPALLALGLAVVARAEVATIAPERVTIPSGEVQLGSQPEALEAALALCRAERRLDAGAGCALELFALELAPERHHVAAFAIDRTEVSRGDYLRCVARGLCRPAEDAGSASDDPRWPITGVDAARAEGYCRARGGRLPSELEWGRAAQGDDGRTFPWGDGADAGRANHGRAPALADAGDGFPALAPVGSFAAGASPLGVLDLAGNVWEWTSSLPRPEDLSLFAARSAAAHRIVRGGSYLSPLHELRASARGLAAVDAAARDLGFRCAYDP